MFAAQNLIEFLKGLFKCLGIVTLLEGLGGLEDHGDLLGAELGHLDSSVAVKNGEKEDFLIDAMEEYGILHVFAPAWIGRGVPCI